MKRILIISELFHPQNAIGALRPTKIRNGLIKKGYDVDVITRSFSNKNDRANNGIVWRIDSVEETKHINSSSAPLKKEKRFIQELKRIKRTIMSINKGKCYCNHVIEFIEKKNIALSDYETIITTFGPISSVMIGLALKKRYPDVNWICDFRDPLVVKEASALLNPLMSLVQDKACKTADHIVAVSNGYLKRICGDKYISKRHMIPNGYDISDSAVLESSTPPKDVIHIAYVGTLYEGRRKITPLFRALRELANCGAVDLNKFRFDYAGRDGDFLLAQASEYGLDFIIYDHRVLSREECLKLQSSSHFLVLSTWNNHGEEGVFPGKFLEYMLIKRPIISLTDGNIPDGEVTLVMREGQFGVAYESVHDKEDMEQLKNYIETCYCEWSQKGSITFEPVQEVLERYNYDNIINKIEGLINGQE